MTISEKLVKKFLDKVFKKYSEVYPKHFFKAFSELEPVVRESEFSAHYDSAYTISFNEGDARLSSH